MSGSSPRKPTGDRIATGVFWLVLGTLGLLFGFVLLANGLERSPLMAVAGAAVLVLTVLGLLQAWRTIRGR